MSGRRGVSGARRSEPGPEQDRRRGGAGRILVFGVALFVLTIVVLGVFSTSQGKEEATAGAPPQNADRIDVVYFHRTERCDSCLWAGQMSRKTVESYFAGELATGRVTFQEVDVQKPENRTLAYRFKASGSQLFVNYVIQGRDNIREARQVYPYVGNEARFSGLLRSMIAAGLGKS